MDRLLVFQYLKDGAGNYILDGNDNLIVNATSEYPVELSTAGIASHRGDLKGVNSFTVLANDDLSDWTLIINQYNLVGRFPSQATALGALVGCFIHAGATQDGLEFMISEMVQNGTGQIDEDGDNLMSQKIKNGEFIGTLRNFNKDLWAGTTNSMQQDLLVVGNVTEQLLLADPLQTIVVPAEYGNSYSFEVRTDKPLPNAISLPAEVIPALTNENLSFPKQTPLVGVAYEADFTVDGLDSRIPVNTVYTWSTSAPGAGSWQERQTGSSSSFTPLENYAGLVIRCEVELFYLDGTSTGIASSETTSAIGQVWEWTGDPFLYETTVGQTIQVTPEVDSNIQPTGTGQGGGLSYTYEFMKNNTTVQSGSSNVYNFNGVAGTYTCEVTANQTFNGLNYQSTRDSAPPFIVTPNITPEISYLEMWTGINDSAPDGTQITNLNSIPPGSTYYVFAYDQFDALITDEVLYGDSQSPVNPATVTGTPSHQAPAIGTELSLSSMVVTGDPARSVSYSWKVGGIEEGTGETYTVAPADDGKTIALDVTVVSGSALTLVENFSFGTVGGAGTAPTWLVVPTASETNPDIDGSAVTCDGASADGDPSPTISYDWQRDGVSIGAADSVSYTPVNDDDGTALTCVVTATNGVNPDLVETVSFGTPALPAASPIQTLTYTVGGSAPSSLTVSISNVTGLDIVDNDRTSSVLFGPTDNNIRFWNGDEANSYGATAGAFPTNVDCRAWWEDNYQARVRINGGSWLICDQKLTPGTIFFAGASGAYNNVGDAAGAQWPVSLPVIAPADVIDVEIYTKGQLPS